MRRLSRRLALGTASLALLALALLPEASAQELTGTLKKVKEAGALTIGYRASSIPFSYLNLRRQPIGYAIDLCQEIVEEVGSELGVPIGVAYKLVTAEDRIPQLVSGAVDLECGSTTSNFQRQKQVAFSPVFFVAGTKLMVRKGSGIASYRDLAGKRVVVTAGTTNEAALHALVEKQKLDIRILSAPDHAQSFQLLASGGAEAFATDDVLLYGMIATAKGGSAYEVVGEYLSYDPYGLMYRKDDPAFAEVVARTFQRLAESRQLVEYYDKWFQKRLPTGETLGLPMSPQLEEIFRMLGVPES